MTRSTFGALQVGDGYDLDSMDVDDHETTVRGGFEEGELSEPFHGRRVAAD